MKKIALVGNSSLSIVKFRSHLIKAWQKSGYAVIVISPMDEFSADFNELGVKWIDWEVTRDSKNIFKELTSLSSLFNILAEEKPSLIQFFTIKPNIYGALVAHWLGIPSIAVMTGLGYVFINQNVIASFARFLYRLTLRLHKKVLFLNRTDQQVFINNNLVSIEKCHLLPGEGIEVELFPVRSILPKRRFVYIGRILWDKGFKEYVEAAKKILKEKPEIEFLAVGKIGFGNPSDVPLSYVEEMERLGIIKYVSFVKDVKGILSEALFNVLPSYREGIPTTVLEAGCMQVPSIVSDAPGCDEVVLDGVTGFVCEKKSADSLVKTLRAAIELSESDYQKMCVEARNFIISNFEKDIVLRHYRNIYQSLGYDFL